MMEKIVQKQNLNIYTLMMIFLATVILSIWHQLPNDDAKKLDTNSLSFTQGHYYQYFFKIFALFSFEFPTQCARSKKNLVKRESSRCDKKVWDIWDEQVEVVVVVEVAVNFSIPTTIHTICMTYSVMGNESPGSSAAAAFTVVSITP